MKPKQCGEESIAALRRWAEGRPLLLSLVAQELALTARPSWQTCERARYRSWMRNAFKGFSIEHWLSLYVRPFPVNKAFAPLVPEEAPLTAWIDFANPLASLRVARVQGNVLADLEEAHTTWMTERLQQGATEASGPKESQASAEFVFFYRVWAPCWLGYGALPETLFHNARAGDLESMQKLLSVDPNVVEDPLTRARFLDAMHGGSVKEKEALTAALNHEVPPVSLADVKVLIASLISKLFVQAAPRGLLASEIRDLFDAIAGTAPGEAHDPDLPKSNEALQKEIVRNLAYWGNF